MIATTKATYKWTPEAADAGNYEFAAFVNTEIQPLPWLEVAPNSVQKVEVSCFSAGIQAIAPGQPQMQAASARRIGPQATTCADTWVGTTTSGDAAYGPNQTEATLTLKVDDRVTGQGPGQVFYYAEGTLKVNRRVTDLNGVHCEYLPFEIVIDRNTGSNTPGHGGESNQFSVNYSESPPTAGGAGVATGTQTIVCTSRHDQHDQHDHERLRLHVGAAGRPECRRAELECQPPAFLFVQLHAPVARQRRVRNRGRPARFHASRHGRPFRRTRRDPAPAALQLRGEPRCVVAAGAAVPLEASDALMLAYLCLEGPTSRATAGDPAVARRRRGPGARQPAPAPAQAAQVGRRRDRHRPRAARHRRARHARCERRRRAAGVDRARAGRRPRRVARRGALDPAPCPPRGARGRGRAARG